MEVIHIDAYDVLLAWSVQVGRFRLQLDAHRDAGPEIWGVDRWTDMLRTRDRVEALRSHLDRRSVTKVEDGFRGITRSVRMDWRPIIGEVASGSGTWWNRVPFRGPVLEELLSNGLESPTRPLSEAEAVLIGRCLSAAATGPYIPDHEFHTVCGVDRPTMLDVAEEWPACSFVPHVERAVRAALLNLWGYPHGLGQQLVAELEIGAQDELRFVLDRWGWIAAGKAGKAIVVPGDRDSPSWPGAQHSQGSP